MMPSEFVAVELEINLPEEYIDFLNDTGYLCLSNNSIEVYGYQSGFDIKKIPCVIAATRLNKHAYKLDSFEIVISHTGFEDLITVLDCKTGKVWEFAMDGIKQEIAKSFKTWLKETMKKNGAAI